MAAVKKVKTAVKTEKTGSTQDGTVKTGYGRGKTLSQQHEKTTMDDDTKYRLNVETLDSFLNDQDVTGEIGDNQSATSTITNTSSTNGRGGKCKSSDGRVAKAGTTTGRNLRWSQPKAIARGKKPDWISTSLGSTVRVGRAVLANRISFMLEESRKAAQNKNTNQFTLPIRNEDLGLCQGAGTVDIPIIQTPTWIMHLPNGMQVPLGLSQLQAIDKVIQELKQEDSSRYEYIPEGDE